VSLDAEQDVGEVLDGVDAVDLAGGYQRVEAGQVLTGLVVPNEEEVLSSEGGDAERPFRRIMPRPRLCRASARLRGLQRQGAVGNAA